jgi:hypothetical protein
MRRRTAIPLLSCALALAIAGCGSDGGTIPENEGQGLLGLLAATEEAVANGDCERAQEFARTFVAEAEGLPASVDPKVAEELTAAGTHLEDLAGDPGECETGASGLTGEQPSEPATSEPETTDTTDEPETTEEPETTTEPETTEEPAQEEPTEEPTQQPPTNPGNGASQDGGLEPPSGGVGPGGGGG